MIQIKNLSKQYGQHQVFSNLTFAFPSKGLCCLFGASGCGKSTLLHMIAGFDLTFEGDLTVCDTSLQKLDAEALCNYRKNHVGFIFQNYHVLSGYTVLENVLLSSDLQSDDEITSKKKAEQLLCQLSMIEKKDQLIETLSGGEKQRVAIARALMNEPSMILADEPTGALDRSTANELMCLLKELSKTRLVLVITHDQKLCEFADHLVSIKDGKLIGEAFKEEGSKTRLKETPTMHISAFRHGWKAFKVHLTRYIAISFAIAIGVLAFMLSLSSSNMMGKEINDFKEKNTAFNNGYIKVEDDGSSYLSLLNKDPRIENVYQQFILEDIRLTLGEQQEVIAEKYPMPKATEVLSYGVMPNKGEHSIALSPSLAKKFQKDIDQLIGSTMTLTYREKEYTLTICGIFNAGYDDFFVSSDIEQQLYQDIEQKTPYSISYDVTQFEDIVLVDQSLMDHGIKATTAVKEVAVLQTTFEHLSRLFSMVSLLIVMIGLCSSVLLLVKLQHSRVREIGLLSALGYHRQQIRAMMLSEYLLLTGCAMILNVILMVGVYMVSKLVKIELMMTIPQVILSIVGTGIIVIFICLIASHRLLRTDPAVALRK